jgi:putative flippase GtrA
MWTVDIKIFKYIFAGVITTCLDFVTYRLLLYITAHVDISKAIGTTLGIILAYFINKNWTFNAKGASQTQLVSFFLLYSFSLLVNILVNHLILFICNQLSEVSIIIAFSIAAIVSAAINFIGMKYFVFIKRRN